MQNVFVACPTHDGRIFFKTAEALYDQCSREHQLFISIGQTSLLNFNCNGLWAQALNMAHRHKMKWFAMLHSDVVPEHYWLDKMISLAEQHDADMLSACVAIKDEGGDVSTALSNPANDHWSWMRLGPGALVQLPETFSKEDLQKLNIDSNCKLLVNTGCCIIRLNREWSPKVLFKSVDRMIINEQNQFQALADPEDWNISRQIDEHGGKVMATRAISCAHIGTKSYQVKAANV
jgi:hypothetical protein